MYIYIYREREREIMCMYYAAARAPPGWRSHRLGAGHSPPRGW